MTEFLADYGPLVLFAILAVQTAGIPGPPGKTALMIAAVLAADGHFSLPAVLGAALAGLLVGGAAGFYFGATGLRWLIAHPLLERKAGRGLRLGEEAFEAHGPKAVLVARFLPGAKVVIALVAGAAGMSARAFALWHGLASVLFVLAFGVGAYLVGESAVSIVERWGLLALLPLAVFAAAGWGAWRLHRRRAALAYAD